jgi:hypothetical protein
MSSNALVIRIVAFTGLTFSTTACQPPGISERTIQPPHKLYQQAEAGQVTNDHPLKPPGAIQAKPQLIEQGLPTHCQLATSATPGFCITCDHRPIAIQRCQPKFSPSFNPDRHCRYSKEKVKCLDPTSKTAMAINLRTSREKRFLLQLNMISETLTTIFENELKNAKAQTATIYIIELIQKNRDIILTNSQQLTERVNDHSKLAEDQKQAIIKTLNEQLPELQEKRRLGHLKPQDALDLILTLMQASTANPQVSRIVNQLDLQGLDSLD